jgi:hypothetical protein
MSLKSPETVLRNALVDDPYVCMLVGTRVYPQLAPASATLPFIHWRRSAIEREQTLGKPAGIPRVSLEYEIYGTTYREARDVADAVRSVLDGYGGTSDNTEVKQTSLEDESDDFVTLAGADLPPVYRVTQRYDVWWSE